MEINRNEAELEFQMAQHKLHEKDFEAARESALRAQKLFPGLEGLDQLLESLNVLVHSNSGPHGEDEWYGILGVDPSDSHQVIRKSYYRKSRLLHPDKTRDILGAGDAIRLLTLAWGVLSDQESRAEYDRRKEEADKFYDFFKESAADLSSSVPFASSHFEEVFKKGAAKHPKPPTVATSPKSASKSQAQQGSSSESKLDQMFNQTAANPETPTSAATTTSPKSQTRPGSSSRSSSKPRGQKGTSGPNPNPQPRKYSKSSRFEKARPAARESFWTICTNCKMRYEYDRIYLNAKLTCPATDCKQFFPAIAIPPPKKTYKRKQSPSRETPESRQSYPPQDASGNDPVFKVPKPFTPPILATPVSSVLFSATARARSLIIKPVTGDGETVQDAFLGQPDGSDLDTETTAARRASEKGKMVVIEEPSGKEIDSLFRKS